MRWACVQPLMSALSGPPGVMAAFGLGHGQGGEIGSAGHPVRQIATGAADDIDAAPTIKEQRSAREMREDGEIEIALEIGARHEPPEQARRAATFTSRACPRGSLKMKGVPGPVAASRASRMDHAP